MINNKHDIEKIISQTSFRPLTNEEQRRVWEGVDTIQGKSLFIYFKKKYMLTSFIIALVLVFGAGGTAVLADNAVPGDTLFGVDRAVENIRIRLADKEKKNELRIKFADERVREVESITSSTASMQRPAVADITETTVSEIEADVFINETVIKIEYSDKKFVFTSNAKTKDTVVDEIVNAFPSLSKTFVETKLDFEIEDRTSKDDDKRGKISSDDLSEDKKIHVTTGVAAALALLNGISTSVDGDAALRLKAITDELNDYLKTLPENQTVETRINESDKKTRVELRTEDGRIKVEVRDDGEVRIKTDDDDKNRGWDKDDTDTEDDSTDDSDDTKAVQSLEIEADIFTNETVIKVEMNDRKSTFTTDADTRAEIVTAILAKYPTLTTAQIEAVLNIETEDRDSHIKDITSSIGKESDDDNEKEEDKDDRDSDNSGHGGSDDKEDDD